MGAVCTTWPTHRFLHALHDMRARDVIPIFAFRAVLPSELVNNSAESSDCVDSKLAESTLFQSSTGLACLGDDFDLAVAIVTHLLHNLNLVSLNNLKLIN